MVKPRQPRAEVDPGRLIVAYPIRPTPLATQQPRADRREGLANQEKRDPQNFLGESPTSNQTHYLSWHRTWPLLLSAQQSLDPGDHWRARGMGRVGRIRKSVHKPFMRRLFSDHLSDTDLSLQLTAEDGA